MRKNKTMRIASVLLVAVLLSTCAICGTFAKYVTSESATDSARVAKFGVTITATGTTFAKTYETHDTAVSGTITNSVVGTTNLVAPGTSGSVASVTLSGTPEVATKINYAADLDLGNNWVLKADTTKAYCPIKITVNGTTLKGLDYETTADFETAVENLIAGVTANYAAGTDLSAQTTLAVSWEWSFADATAYANGTQTDADDTFLGDRAAADAGNAGTIALKVTTTITQID